MVSELRHKKHNKSWLLKLCFFEQFKESIWTKDNSLSSYEKSIFTKEKTKTSLIWFIIYDMKVKTRKIVQIDFTVLHDKKKSKILDTEENYGNGCATLIIRVGE